MGVLIFGAKVFGEAYEGHKACAAIGRNILFILGQCLNIDFGRWSTGM
jgi:hypothetical protein